MPNIIGIDLGAHTVKAVIFEGSFGRYQLVDSRLRAVPAADAEDIDRRLMALVALLGELDLEQPLSVVGWPAEHTSIRRITLPFGDRAQVEKTLPFEVEAQVPFDLDETSLAHRILSVSPGESVVLTAMASQAAVSALLQQLKSVGIDPKHLPVDSDVLGAYTDAGVQAVLDIGHTRTLAAITEDGKVLASRAIIGGGRALTAALASHHRISMEEAEGRKHICHLESAQGPLVTEVSWDDEDITEAQRPTPEDSGVLLKALAPLLADIRATLIAFEDSTGLEIEEVLLCGGTAALRGLREHLSADLGVPVRKIIPEGIDAIAPSRFALALALARQGAGETTGRELDIRQGDLSFQGDLASLSNLLRVGLMAAVVLLVLGTGWFTVRYMQLSSDLSEVEAQISSTVAAAFPEDVPADRVLDPSTALAIMQEKSLESSARVEALGSILSDAPPTLSLLKKVSKGMPPHAEVRVDVKEMTITRSSITLKAESDGYEEATRVEASLQEMEGFRNATKGNEKKNKDSVRFTVTIPLDETVTEEG